MNVCTFQYRFGMNTEDVFTFQIKDVIATLN